MRLRFALHPESILNTADIITTALLPVSRGFLSLFLVGVHTFFKFTVMGIGADKAGSPITILSSESKGSAQFIL